ncbi:FHA domain-containing protein [Hyalangium sp.]|uniref:FHA domain-containing protein n=1 Tax=Hyalangium sp. TaxID=2028555 RepID=UPI002D226E00|nr:FHA domain-containing protein [Hyalangium sp.]HYH98107.1 FHA domain-containing protein [Hyalangium sp.]
MPTLVVRHPDGSETEHELADELTIGRQESNALVLTEGGVSRQHARFFVEGGKVLLEDLSSANGTYVDGERIGEVTVLTSQSQVVLGDYELKLKGGGGRSSTGARKSARPAPPNAGPDEGGPRATRALPSIKPARPPGSALARSERASAGASPPQPMLRGLTGPWANKTYPLRGKVLVGRTPPAGVLLEDDSISRKHAELERNPRGAVFLRDLGSANGTLLNGERIGQEAVEISPGDIVQFGMVEVVYESGDGSSVPVRRDRGGAPAGKGKADPSDAPPPNKRKKLLIVAGATVGLLLAAGVVKQITATPELPPEIVEPVLEDPREKVQALLSECRSFASSDMGSEPQWGKAEAKCEEARVLDPINTEVNALIKKIKLEKESSGYFEQGARLLQRLKEEEALDVLQKISKESQYFRRAKIKMDEALAQVNKRAEDDCKRYLRDGQWSAAVPRCDRYMGYWCQSQTREDLEPPLGFNVSLSGRIGKREWRPKDKLFVQFLIARKKLDPRAELWKCTAGFRGEQTNGDEPSARVRKMFKEKFPNPYMNAALFDYWGGRANEALAKLQKVRSNYEQASLHGQTDDLLKAVSNVDNRFKDGSSDLTAGDVEKAAESFDEALDIDKRLMGDLWETVPSFYRKNIQNDIADKAYERGRDWIKREDPLRACRLWKVGFRFYKGNTDLIRVLSNVCSTQGTRLFSSAGRCEDLVEVALWAVPGDGLEEKMAKKKEELQCK